MSQFGGQPEHPLAALVDTLIIRSRHARSSSALIRPVLIAFIRASRRRLPYE